jgi:formylglycine-generating enzyme required for sulfatase activity
MLVVKVPRPFALGRREVTRGEYAKFVAESAYEPKPGCRSYDAASGRVLLDRTRTWLNPLVPAAPQEMHPVNCVGQADAQAYAQWLSRKTGKSYRLPSEAEWEYAARAGGAARYAWGEDAAFACGEANVYDLGAEDLLHLSAAPVPCRDGQTDLAPVGRFHANAFGLQDLIGNVAEWTQDCATDSYVGRPEDTRAWVWVGGCTQRIVRGGSWRSPAAELAVAMRVAVAAEERNDALGFRVAVDLEK